MPSTDSDRRSIEVFRSRTAAEEGALVLTALDIDWQLEEESGGWDLSVAAADGKRASDAFAAYVAERRPARANVVVDHPGGLLAGLGAAVGLVLFFVAVTVVWGPASEWSARGSSTAARVVGGEWWRVVTALTLHVDASHVVGNSVALAIFATAVCRWFGPGVGLWLILMSGAFGNAVNALARGGEHSAVGASTAVFGAVGILSALQLSRRLGARPSGLMRMRGWAPLAAGLALLALLGSSETSDVAAHLFGFGCGIALGLLASWWRAERVGAWWQATLLVGAGAALCGCWRWALAAS